MLTRLPCFLPSEFCRNSGTAVQLRKHTLLEIPETFLKRSWIKQSLTGADYKDNICQWGDGEYIFEIPSNKSLCVWKWKEKEIWKPKRSQMFWYLVNSSVLVLGGSYWLARVHCEYLYPVAWNQSWWESLYHRNYQVLHINPFTLTSKHDC